MRLLVVCSFVIGCAAVVEVEDGGGGVDGGAGVGAGAAGPGPGGGPGVGPGGASPTVGAGAPQDDPGDVARPEADIVESDLRVVGDVVDFRVRFAAAPFPNDMTQDLVICVDADANEATGGSCAMAATGIDAYVSLDGIVGPPQGDLHITAGEEDLDPCEAASFDAASFTLRITFPLASIDDDPSFRFILSSNFGGSGGVVDNQPPPGQWFESVVASSLLPWSGTPLCF